MKNLPFTIGDSIKIDIGDGPETVTVLDSWSARGVITFFNLQRKRGAPYTLTLSRILKSIVE